MLLKRLNELIKNIEFEKMKYKSIFLIENKTILA